MTSGQIVFVVLVFVLLAVALLLAFAYGYTKGINDLTEEIDRGLKKLQEGDAWRIDCAKVSLPKSEWEEQHEQKERKHSAEQGQREDHA